MRKTSNYLFLLAFILLFGSCEEADEGPFVEPITVYEKIKGSWVMESITMEDRYAIATNLATEDQNVTAYFGFESYSIQFNVDANDNPTTFETGGNAPELFLQQGYWDLNSAFPFTGSSSVIIQLFSDADKSNKVDELVISNIPGASPLLQYRLNRSYNDAVYLSYFYVLKRAN